MKRQCEGYCGGYIHGRTYQVGRGGERFCKECYERWKEVQSE